MSDKTLKDRLDRERWERHIRSKCATGAHEWRDTKCVYCGVVKEVSDG